MTLLALIYFILFNFHIIEGRLNQEQKSDLIFKRDNALLSKKYSTVVKICNQLLKLNPDDHTNLFKRATANFGLYKYKLAIRDLSKFINLDKQNILGYIYLAKANQFIGNTNEAIDNYNKVIQLDKSKSHYRETIDSMRRVEKLERKIPREFKFSRRNCKRYLSNINEIINIHKYHKIYLFKYAKCMFLLKDYQNSVMKANLLLKTDKNNLDVYLLKSRAHFQMEDFDTSVIILKQALKNDPEHKELKSEYKIYSKIMKLNREAKGNISKGRLTKALGNYEKILNVLPENNDVNKKFLLEICQIYVKVKNPSKAIKYCDQVLRKDPESINGYIARGDAKMMNGDYEDAIRDYHIANEKSPNDHNIRQKIHTAEIKIKQAKKKDYYKILGVSPSASSKEIKTAYKKLALKWHPDKWKSKEDKKKAEKKFHDIGEAKEILGDKELRQRYDNGEDVLDKSGGQQYHGEGFPFNFANREHFGGNGQRFYFKFN